VVRVSSRIGLAWAVPKKFLCDNGAEFTSKALDLWAYHAGVRVDFSRPGKPTDNAYVESFNGTLRDGVSGCPLVRVPDEAKQTIEAWRHEYNESPSQSSRREDATRNRL
jgi:putative transposase